MNDAGAMRSTQSIGDIDSILQDLIEGGADFKIPYFGFRGTPVFQSAPFAAGQSNPLSSKLRGSVHEQVRRVRAQGARMVKRP